MGRVMSDLAVYGEGHETPCQMRMIDEICSVRGQSPLPLPYHPACLTRMILLKTGVKSSGRTSSVIPWLQKLQFFVLLNKFRSM
jgi:hypothetical protein